MKIVVRSPQGPTTSKILQEIIKSGMHTSLLSPGYAILWDSVTKEQFPVCCLPPSCETHRDNWTVRHSYLQAEKWSNVRATWTLFGIAYENKDPFGVF